MLDQRPIVAIATAPGKGAIGVVRLSSPSLAAIDQVIDALIGRRLSPRQAHYGPFLAADGGAIDMGLALLFPAPASYTGEHVLELQGHGGPVVQRMLLARVLEAGHSHDLRLAEPGEFTERAFLNDKLDLAQAEAVADLIEASTEQAARSATRSLSGVFSERIDGLAAGLLELRMLVEATLDFPEEEIEFLESAKALPRLAAITADLDAVLATARQGALLREGLSVVLVGAPNVGKSSLLNALAGADVAIVTPIAGTTRDRVRERIAIEGVPLNLVDTAGLRESDDVVERIGIEHTWAEIEQADVILHLVAAADESDPSDQSLWQAIDQRAPARAARLVVVNKIDLTGLPPGEYRAGADADVDAGAVVGVRLSAKTGAGLDALRQTLLAVAGYQPGAEDVFAARGRHLEALREARTHIERARAHGQQGDTALDLFAEELRLAHAALGRITGAVTADDLLGVIFSRFCIGK